MLPEDLPAQVDAPAFAGCATGGASHGGDPEGALGHLQHMGVITVTEQLRAQRRDELAATHIDRAAAPLLHFHLMADVSCELNQTVFHSYVSAAGDVLPSAADLTDFSD